MQCEWNRNHRTHISSLSEKIPPAAVYPSIHHRTQQHSLLMESRLVLFDTIEIRCFEIVAGNRLRSWSF